MDGMTMQHGCNMEWCCFVEMMMVERFSHIQNDSANRHEYIVSLFTTNDSKWTLFNVVEGSFPPLLHCYLYQSVFIFEGSCSWSEQKSCPLGGYLFVEITVNGNFQNTVGLLFQFNTIKWNFQGCNDLRLPQGLYTNYPSEFHFMV